jgi:hypothetical protein
MEQRFQSELVRSLSLPPLSFLLLLLLFFSFTHHCPSCLLCCAALSRNKLGIDLARRTLELYIVLLSDTDILPKTKALPNDSSSSSSPSLSSYASTNTIETLSSSSLPPAFFLPKRPHFLTNYWDISLSRIVGMVLQCFNRIDEGEITTTLQTIQVLFLYFFLLLLLSEHISHGRPSVGSIDSRLSCCGSISSQDLSIFSCCSTNSRTSL